MSASANNTYMAGVADGLRCVGMIRASGLSTRNRLAFLTMDSVLEIALRVFLKHKKRISLDPLKSRPRSVLLDAAKKNLQVDPAIWDQLTHYYEDIRCPLYHQASDMTASEPILDDFVETVLFLMQEMFAVDGRVYIDEGTKFSPSPQSAAPAFGNIQVKSLSKMDRVVMALGHAPMPNAKAVLGYMRSIGLDSDLSTNTISTYLSRGRYFYWSEEENLWKLTELIGKRRLEELRQKEE